MYLLGLADRPIVEDDCQRRFPRKLQNRTVPKLSCSYESLIRMCMNTLLPYKHALESVIVNRLMILDSRSKRF
jgi:hypothetical protein